MRYILNIKTEYFNQNQMSIDIYFIFKFCFKFYSYNKYYLKELCSLRGSCQSLLQNLTKKTTFSFGCILKKKFEKKKFEKKSRFFTKFFFFKFSHISPWICSYFLSAHFMADYQKLTHFGIVRSNTFWKKKKMHASNRSGSRI